VGRILRQRWYIETELVASFGGCWFESAVWGHRISGGVTVGGGGHLLSGDRTGVLAGSDEIVWNWRGERGWANDTDLFVFFSGVLNFLRDGRSSLFSLYMVLGCRP